MDTQRYPYAYIQWYSLAEMDIDHGFLNLSTDELCGGGEAEESPTCASSVTACGAPWWPCTCSRDSLSSRHPITAASGPTLIVIRAFLVPRLDTRGCFRRLAGWATRPCCRRLLESHTLAFLAPQYNAVFICMPGKHFGAKFELG